MDRGKTRGRGAALGCAHKGGTHHETSATQCRDRGSRCCARSAGRGRGRRVLALDRRRARSSRRDSPRSSGIERKVNALLEKMTLAGEAAAAAAALGRPDHRRGRQGRRRRASSASPTRRRSTTSSTSRSSSRGCTSRSCSPTTRSTATARSSRSRSAPRAASTRRWPRPTTPIGARETATVGIKQIYSPMVDVSHEPRWGRIAEGAGEDPYLGSVFAAARVQGRPGHRLLGARQGRRRASSTSSPTASPRAAATTTRPTCRSQRLRNLYLPPFKAAIDAGADTVMCSFNAINGVPGLREPRHSRRDILKKRVGLRRLHRERLHRRRRAARLPAEDPGHRPVRPRRRRRRPGAAPPR